MGVLHWLGSWHSFFPAYSFILCETGCADPALPSMLPDLKLNSVFDLKMLYNHWQPIKVLLHNVTHTTAAVTITYKYLYLPVCLQKAVWILETKYLLNALSYSSYVYRDNTYVFKIYCQKFTITYLHIFTKYILTFIN